MLVYVVNFVVLAALFSLLLWNLQ